MTTDDTTKRFFYSDPLAAAWQAKHHEMKIQVQYPGGGMRDVTKAELLRVAPGKWTADKFYVDPDSEHLLEPQCGDLVTFDGESAFLLRSGEFMHDAKIIQRNNLPFMTPETEEV